MGSKLRRSGLDIIGDIPWGSHFCNFYQTEQDLLDVLVPFIKAGLESNEFCLWVVSDVHNQQEAGEAAESAISNYDRYQEKGQIEIVPYTCWYHRNGWGQVAENAISRGFYGLRIAGSMAWLGEKSRESIMEYERVINKMIKQFQMIALCSYSLSRCMACDVIDMVNSHQFALFSRGGRWEIFEAAQCRKTELVMRDIEENYTAIGNQVSGMAHEINNQMTVIQACLDLYARDSSSGLACSKIRQAVERTIKLNRLMLYSRAKDNIDKQLL